MEEKKTKRPEVGDRVRVLSLPVGSSFPKKFINRVGKIVCEHNMGPDSPKYYSIELDRIPRQRREYVIRDMFESRFEIINK